MAGACSFMRIEGSSANSSGLGTGLKPRILTASDAGRCALLSPLRTGPRDAGMHPYAAPHLIAASTLDEFAALRQRMMCASHCRNIAAFALRHQTERTMERPTMTTKAMLAAQLLLSPLAMSAQDVAQLSTGARMADQGRETKWSTGEDPITDDGHDADRLSPAAQFVITSEPHAKGTLHVQIRDEAGRVVQDRSYADRTTIAVDLGHLQHGRYAARVERGGQVVVRRFVRP